MASPGVYWFPTDVLYESYLTREYCMDIYGQSLTVKCFVTAETWTVKEGRNKLTKFWEFRCDLPICIPVAPKGTRFYLTVRT